MFCDVGTMYQFDELGRPVNMFREVFLVSLFCFVQANYELEEGEPCVSEGLNGTCRRLRYCPTVSLVVLKEWEPKLPPICSFIGKEPVVCCTDCNVTDVTKIVVTTDGIEYKLGTNKSYDMCLEYTGRLPYSCKTGVKSRLIKVLDKERSCHYLYVARQYLLIGELAERGEFPHMALLGYGEEAASAEWLCGGSVISDRFILTAAHCSEQTRLGPVRYVALGILRRSDPPALWQRHQVRRLLPHPGYRPPSKYHDIALIETTDKIKFSPLVLPICVADRELDSTSAQAEGWGAEGHNKPSSDGLRKAWLERFSEEECGALYPQHRHQALGLDPGTQLCYGDRKDNKDTCQGDSGGPLQMYGGRSCVEYVVGVTSYGRACGFTGGAGVYTKVLPYIKWIEENVWP